jgi:hypothetical protein
MKNKKVKRSIFIALALLLVSGCKNCPEQSVIYIRDTLVQIQPPLIIDSGQTIKINDSLFQFLKIDSTGKDAKDTVVDIRFYPKIEKVFYKVKPDTVRVRVRDTIKISTKGRDSPAPPGVIEKNKTFFTILAISLLILAIALLIEKWKK